ncbi:MAG: hypothetical protein KAS32_05590 [Candidatus Peribacteraceae bacterium]|nr:hypothetical protein [Candidatus Peribacteraceae bacterium]
MKSINDRLRNENEDMRALLREALPFIEQLNKNAETVHDDPDDEGYEDLEVYRIMLETSSLSLRIKETVNLHTG